MKITIKNYEEYALDYLEGRLDEETKCAFDQFLDRHPEIREELNQVKPVDLPEQETPSFPAKKDLLRDAPIIRAFKQPLYVPIWSVAACLVLLVGFFLWWNLTGPEPAQERRVAIEPRFESAEKQTALEELKEEMDARNIDKPMSEIYSSETDQGKNKQFSFRSKAQVEEEAPAPNGNETVSSEPGSVHPEIKPDNATMPTPSASEKIVLEFLSTPELSELPNRVSRVHPLDVQQPAPLAISKNRQLGEAPKISPASPEKKDSFFLSDELADLTPSSWPGQINTEQIKEAFLPKAFSK